MASVWKRLQRVGKHASKFQFVASYQELMVECTKKWQPDKLVVVWTRRSRRKSSKESPSGRRKALATSSINMKQYASPMPTQTDVKLKFKPLSKKIVAATLQFSLSCIFLREGKATDEDMQSLASLMSMKQADIGNLDDFEEENEEDDENRVNQEEKSAKITELINKLNILEEEEEPPVTRLDPFREFDTPGLNPFGDPDDDPDIEERNIGTMSAARPEESFYDNDPNNPFNEQYENSLNPFDVYDPQPDRIIENRIEAIEPPKPMKRQNVKPVDMSKYLYADTTKTEEEELDESNPFYEPKAVHSTKYQTSLVTASVQQAETEKKTKRKAPSPPAPDNTSTPKTETVKVYVKPAAVIDISSSPKVWFSSRFIIIFSSLLFSSFELLRFYNVANF
ncbi:hypothetical protein chiPu_0016239 [Chiloscyllium punctatum]|uniref:C2 NT-type domain-containing protein n=1 Tax=Chiloscyllium punctatum TaxID=137246 RepID=A0A401T4Y6_CHIPU|nr:hypothetical protein [Chiloscyllium punctatum]